MKEIKFRARNAALPPSWFYGYFAIRDGTCLIINSDGVFKVIAGTESEYTGLRDKNGTEIYEGDIVRATANGNRKYEVVWEGYGLGHWWIADIQRDNLIPNKIPINLNAIELIGNIWETPELLTKAHKITQEILNSDNSGKASPKIGVDKPSDHLGHGKPVNNVRKPSKNAN